MTRCCESSIIIDASSPCRDEPLARKTGPAIPRTRRLDFEVWAWGWRAERGGGRAGSVGGRPGGGGVRRGGRGGEGGGGSRGVGRGGGLWVGG